MTGEEWLRHTFDPALRTIRPPFEELRTGLQGLLLSEEEVSRARLRLDEDERGRREKAQRRHERLHARREDGTEDRLEGLLTPERQLGEVDGITVVVMRVELWTSRLILWLEARQNQLTDALDATFETERKAWERRWVEDRAAAEADDLPLPEQPSVSRLGGLPISIADDVGTRYHAMGGAIGGAEHPWRAEWRLEPEVPSSASVLRVALEDGEPGRERLELVLPSRT